MSEAKPTPGPWYAKNHVVHTDAMPKRFWGDANQYSGPYIVMQTGLYSGPDDATTYANARLVADAGTVFHTTGLTPSQLVERVKELEETLQAVKHNQSASVAPIAYVDGDDAMRRILWEPTQAAFDIPVGTKLYTQPTPADAEDAARYRWLRRWKGQEHEPPFTVQHEIDGTLWGGDLDAAIDAALSKARPNTAEPQGVAYAELPEPGLRIPEGDWTNVAVIRCYTADQMLDFADRTHALRTSAVATPDVKRFYRGSDGMTENQAGDWVTYDSHIAALRATHGQAPAAAKEPSP